MHTQCLINGRPGDSIAVSDRGVQYGDGLFETIAVCDGRCELWDRHMQRLLAGCERLRIPPPEIAQLAAEARQLVHDSERCILKIIITRGSGGRGYRVPETAQPTRILLRDDWPEYPPENSEQGVRARLCSQRLGTNASLAGLKHLNRLEQVLARMEWDDPAIAEGLLQDHAGRVIEGTFTNIFLVQHGRIVTPMLDMCGVAGVMRAVVVEFATMAGIDCEERVVSLDELYAAEELFLTNSLIGIWPIQELDNSREHWRAAPGPVTRTLQAAFHRLRYVNG
ncbi:MAG: aminodeoxychorismate lyase [Gammaproteobacteria bacterium]|nr:aminodeoxychorismate lyase [Gammaproteobacteria bacterium]